jgi:hypothetical protein
MTPLIARTAATLCVIFGLALALSGCTTLKPWERSLMMSGVMEERSGDMGDRLEDHMHVVRESARGASSGGGAACGCS